MLLGKTAYKHAVFVINTAFYLLAAVRTDATACIHAMTFEHKFLILLNLSYQLVAILFRAVE